MFEDFFENNAPADEVIPGRERTEQIKAAVMQRIEQTNPESEEKKMKRRFLRPFVIAAAAAAVGTGSLVTANAATNGIVADTITKAFTAFSGNDAEQSEVYEIKTDDGNVVYYTMSDDKADSPDLKAETILSDDQNEVYYYTMPADKADSPDLEVDTIVSDDQSVVYYYTVTDDKADVMYDYVFSLEKNGASK